MGRCITHRAAASFALLVSMLLASCSDEQRPRFAVTIQVVDESGQPISDARISFGDRSLTTDAGGNTSMSKLEGPVAALVSAEGMITEPLLVGWSDAERTVSVRLYSREGGRRFVMHFGGDVMFGRRYEMPVAGAPLIPADNAASGAEHVVSLISRLFGAADLSMINLETVVSDFPLEEAYPGKRFILNSRPGTLAGVEALGTDLVITANNHQRDYLDPGVETTIEALDDRGIPYVGSSLSPIDSMDPITLTTNQWTVGVLAYTSVTGSVVNDAYPEEDDPIPSGLADDEYWQYEERIFGFSGAELQIPTAAYRIGTVWNEFATSEPSMSQAERTSAWQAMVQVYPELQDWVARRGHGGAAPWLTEPAVRAISDLAASTDLVVVQLHAGFQFQEASSATVQETAHLAIDAGADIVIAHHPHVLQGLEWYKGKLIAYSLGNFVFDQDFLSTFRSMFVRTIWDGPTLLEARLIPVELVDYRPAAVTDEAAMETLLHVYGLGMLGAAADRDEDFAVRAFLVEPNPDAQLAHLRIERHTAVVGTDPVESTVSIHVEGNSVATVPKGHLVHARLGIAAGGSDNVWLGRELLGWGRFEDEVAGAPQRGTAHWEIPRRSEIVVSDIAPEGRGFLRLRRYHRELDGVRARPVARIPLPGHRLFARGESGTIPAMGDAFYTFRCKARMEGDSQAQLRLDFYHFDDTDPTEDPESLLVGQMELPLVVEAGSEFTPIEMEIPQMSGANMVLVYFEISRPEAHESHLDVDDVAFVEWRRAADMPDRYGAFEYVRNDSAAAVDLRAPALVAARVE